MSKLIEELVGRDCKISSEKESILLEKQSLNVM